MESNKTNQGLLGQKGTKIFIIRMGCDEMMEAIVCRTVSFSGGNKKSSKEDKCAAKRGREKPTKNNKQPSTYQQRIAGCQAVDGNVPRPLTTK